MKTGIWRKSVGIHPFVRRLKLTYEGLVIKAPQKYEIANYGLSVSFDVKTSWTTALLFGESVTETSWKALGRHASDTPRMKDSWEYQSPKEQILKLLRGSSLPWNHPLLLPCSLMADHSAR